MDLSDRLPQIPVVPVANHQTIAVNPPFSDTPISDLGKLSYFTNLNCWAIKGDDFPNPNHDFQGSAAVRSLFHLPRSD